MVKTPGSHRARHQTCPQFLRSTWPTVHSDGDRAKTKTSILAAMRARPIFSANYAAEMIRHANTSRNSRRGSNEHRSSMSSRAESTPVLHCGGDTDDITEDEGVHHLKRCRFISTSSSGSCGCLRRQAVSMGSLTSSQSSFGDLRSNTASPLLEDGFPFIKKSSSSASPPATGLPDSDYETDLSIVDLITKGAVRDIVSPNPIRISRQDPVTLTLQRLGPSLTLQKDLRNEVKSYATPLTVVDPSILVALPGSGTILGTPEEYCPTGLCDLSGLLSCPPEFLDICVDSRVDLALLRVGSTPYTEEQDDPRDRPGWDIPEDEEKDESREHEQIPSCRSTLVPYRTLSESSIMSLDDQLGLLDNEELQISRDTDGCPESCFSSGSSAACDASDYFGDMSDEEGHTEMVFVWPKTKRIRLRLEEEMQTFVIFPRIPGVAYYGVLPSGDVPESPGKITQGVGAFFHSRSIVHRLGPHGMDQPFDEEHCPEGCGFTFPVPPRDVEETNNLLLEREVDMK